MGSLRQDLAGEVPLLDVRPPHQLLERPPPGSEHGDLDLLRDQLELPSGYEMTVRRAESDPGSRDSPLR